MSSKPDKQGTSNCRDHASTETTILRRRETRAKFFLCQEKKLFFVSVFEDNSEFELFF